MRSIIKSGEAGSFGYLLFLSIISALGGFLFGFDTAVISGTISFVVDKFELDTILEGWFVSSALLGCIIGVSFAGYLSDRFGRKKVLLFASLLFTSSAIGCAFSLSHTTLIIYRILGGLGVGIASLASPLYISEISPAKYRGRMVVLYQFAITIGILTAYFTNALILKRAEVYSVEEVNFIFPLLFIDEVWRGMFFIETIPALIFFLLIFLIPESPRWLVVKNRESRAKDILTNIGGADAASRSIADVKESLARESGSLRDLFKPGFRMALFIGIALALSSQFCGINAIIYYGPQILNQAGFTLSDALDGQVTIGIVNVLFTIVAILTIDKFGRRPILILGIFGIIISMVSIGILFYTGNSNSPALLIFILCFIASFAFSFGPIVWTLINEIYPTSIRGKAVSIASLAIWLGTALIGQFVPWLLENITPAGTFWMFAILSVPAIIITWKLVPETKNRTLEDIEKYWLSKGSIDKR